MPNKYNTKKENAGGCQCADLYKKTIYKIDYPSWTHSKINAPPKPRNTICLKHNNDTSIDFRTTHRDNFKPWCQVDAVKSYAPLRGYVKPDLPFAALSSYKQDFKKAEGHIMREPYKKRSDLGTSTDEMSTATTYSKEFGKWKVLLLL